MAEWISNCADAVTVELIDYGALDFRAGGNGRFYDPIDVLDVPPRDFFAALYGVEEEERPN